MKTAVIVDAVRTPTGRRNGALSGWHPADLASEVLMALVARNDFDPTLVDDVIMGCVSQVGRQAVNIGRSAVLAAGWPESVPATTVDRQCGSSQQALHFAAQGVLAGAYDIAVAAGVEVMSTTPMGESAPDSSTPFGPRARARYADVDSFGFKGLVMQGISSELVCQQWDLAREDLDAYAVRSHALASQARDQGLFVNEIIPVAERRFVFESGEVVESGSLVTADEGIRTGTTLETLANLKPAFLPDGKITAGTSSQISDGASAVLIMSEDKALSLGLRPRARIHSFALAGSDPVTMLTAPIPATQKVLAKAGLTIKDIDHVEINEAFASVVLAWSKELRPDMDRVNPRGGAIALGHPLGCTGTKLMATLLNGLEQSGGRYGLQTVCEGYGLANATIIERLG